MTVLRGVAIVTGALGVAAGYSTIAAARRGDIGVALLLLSATGWCALAAIALWESEPS